MVTGAAGSLMRAGAAMADAFEDSLSARKPSAPSMSSKCSISAWSWPTAPSSALPATLLVPRLTWLCRDWRKGGRQWEAEGQTQTERVCVRERGERVCGDGMRRLSRPIRRRSPFQPFTHSLQTLSCLLKIRKENTDSSMHLLPRVITFIYSVEVRPRICQSVFSFSLQDVRQCCGLEF